MKLSQYLAVTGVTLDQFADNVGDVSISGVRKWLHGQRVPRPEQMRRVAEITGHRVMPNDFVLSETIGSAQPKAGSEIVGGGAVAHDGETAADGRSGHAISAADTLQAEAGR
jgi:hypothetical protein